MTHDFLPRQANSQRPRPLIESRARPASPGRQYTETGAGVGARAEAEPEAEIGVEAEAQQLAVEPQPGSEVTAILRDDFIATRRIVTRGQQQNAAMLALLTLVVTGSILLMLAPVAPRGSLVQQPAIRQGIVVLIGVIAGTLFVGGWLQRVTWERCAGAIEQLLRTTPHEASTVLFLRELLATFADTFATTERASWVDARALASRGIPPEFESQINQVLRQIRDAAAQRAATEEELSGLRQTYQAIQAMTRYYQRQQQIFHEQLWRTVLVEQSQRGVDGLVAESLYVGDTAPEASRLLQAIQARDAAIVRQLLSEESIRADYAATVREACRRFLAGDSAVRVPRHPEAERELGDLAGLAETMNDLLVRAALRDKLLANVRGVVDQSLQALDGRAGANNLAAVVALAHPAALDETMRGLAQSIQALLEQLSHTGLRDQPDPHTDLRADDDHGPQAES